MILWCLLNSLSGSTSFRFTRNIGGSSFLSRFQGLTAGNLKYIGVAVVFGATVLPARSCLLAVRRQEQPNKDHGFEIAQEQM